MAQTQKLSVRTRKPPAYLNFDDEQGENYFKNKMTFKKDSKQIGINTNNMAKLLIKFINQTNSYYCQAEAILKKQINKEDKKYECQSSKIQRKQENSQDNSKKQNLEDKNLQHNKKPKELYSFKGSSKEDIKRSLISKDKKKNMNPQIMNQSNINFLMSNKANPYVARHLNQLEQLYPNLKQFGQTQQPIMGTNQHSSGFINNNTFNENNGHNSANSDIQNKLFKRASYHVATAYHIYFRQMQNKKDCVINNDPTSFAKKLRQEKLKQYQ